MIAPDSQTDGGDGEPDAAEMVALALAALETGGPQALEEYLESIPGSAALIRRRLNALGSAGMMPAPPRATDDAPRTLGEFTIVRRLGSGGMGTVYVARQQSPRRDVALKVLRDEQLFVPGARERFRREVDVLARLQHGNIVPIYAGGEIDGVPYLAMELVAGATLEEILREVVDRDPAKLRGTDLDAALLRAVERRDARAPAHGPQERAPTDPPIVARDGAWVTSCLRIARSIAHALAHAHERGVLHRDVKPSNIMLTLDGRVLLLDFGLARDTDASRLTRTGGILGSAAYMSPEQMRGENATLDGRTDVYSLGVTLYELLTLRPAFARDTIEATRSAVLDGRPQLPRERNGLIPRDAETVCLQAIERDRERRYASATEFAEDLDNLLDLRPIRARRASKSLRFRRWAQRHPAASVAIGAAIVIGIGGPAGYVVQQRRAQSRIESALDRAQQNLLFARDAIDTLLEKVAAEKLLDVPRMQPLRRELLEGALAAYERILANESTSGEIGLDAARSALAVGRMRRELANPEAALAAFDRARELCEGSIAANPTDPTARHLLAEVRAATSGALQEVGRLDEALAAIDAALALNPLMPATRDRVRRAMLLDHLARDAEATVEFDRAAAELAPRLETTTPTPERAAALDDALYLAANRATAVIARERFADALTIADAALARIAAGATVSSTDLDRVLLVVKLESVRAHALTNLERRADAEAQFASAIDRVLKALAIYPENADARRSLIKLENDLGLLLVDDAARVDLGLAHLEECARQTRLLIAEEPTVIDVRLNFAATLVNLGGARHGRGEFESARDRFAEAIALLDTLRVDVPTWPSLEHFSFNALWYLALVHRDLGERAESVAAARRLALARPSDLRGARLAAGIVLNNAIADGVPESLAAEWKSLALDLLRDAARAGSQELAVLEKATDFDPLRDDPRFAEVLELFRANRK